MSVTGWVANVILIAGLWFVGGKKWWAFLLTIIGEIIWVCVAVEREQWDLAVICGIFGLLAFVNLVRWSQQEPPPLDRMAELERWIDTQASFTIECGSSPSDDGSLYVRLSAAGRKVELSNNDEIVIAYYRSGEYNIGNTLMRAIHLWQFDGALKRFRVHLNDPPAELAISGRIWTPDNRVCEVTGSNEYQVRETIKWHYNNAGRDCPDDFLVQEIGLVDNPSS